MVEKNVLVALTEEGVRKDSVNLKDEERDENWDEEEEEEEAVVDDGEVDEGDVHVKPVVRKPVTKVRRCNFEPAHAQLPWRQHYCRKFSELRWSVLTIGRIWQLFDPADVKRVFKDVSSRIMRKLIVQVGGSNIYLLYTFQAFQAFQASGRLFRALLCFRTRLSGAYDTECFFVLRWYFVWTARD